MSDEIEIGKTGKRADGTLVVMTPDGPKPYKRVGTVKGTGERVFLMEDMTHFRVPRVNPQLKRVEERNLNALDAVNAGFDTMIPASDEIKSGFYAGTSGAVRGAARAIKEGDPSVIPETIAQTYKDSQEAERALRKRFREEHPIAYRSGQVGGIFGGTGAAVGRSRQLVENAPRAQAIVRGAKEGATVGAVYGFGDAEGGLRERTEGALEGAVYGGTFGTVLTALPAAVEKVGLGKRASNAWLRITQGQGSDTRSVRAKREAVLKLKQAFERDGISPEQARATLEQWSKLGEKPEVLADLGGENVRALLSSITNLPGPARQQADEIFRLRQSYHSQRMLKDISEAGGVDARKFLDDIDALTAAQKEAAAPLYEKMDSVRFTLRETVGGEARRRSNTDAGDFLERFLGRQQIRKSVRLGKEIADADFEDQVVKELTAIARGEMPDTVSLKTLDYIKRGMDVRIRQVELNDKAKDLGRALKGLRANYRAIVDNLALREGYDYQAARNVYAGYAATQDAVELGRDAVSNKMMPDEIKRALSQMDGAEQEGFRRGFTRKLYEVFSTQPRNTDQTRKLRTDAMEEAMRVVFGDEADALVSNILRESNMIETARTASPRAGSQTARLAASMDDTAMSPDVASALENFATGRPISAGGSLLRGGIRRMNDAAMLPETKEELARLLLSPATPDATQQLALQRLIVLTNRSAAGRPSGALAGSTPEE